MRKPLLEDQRSSYGDLQADQGSVNQFTLDTDPIYQESGPRDTQGWTARKDPSTSL